MWTSTLLPTVIQACNYEVSIPRDPGGGWAPHIQFLMLYLHLLPSALILLPLHPEIWHLMANNLILERLLGVKKRFVEVGDLLTSPDVMSDMKRYIKLNKEYKELKPVVEAYEKYKSAIDNLESTRELLAAEKDEEMREMAKGEIDALLSVIPDMEEEIRYLLLPADPEDDKNAVMEIRAGTGGDEASIFAGDLYRMYSNTLNRGAGRWI
jgi:hypothetical protein